MDMSRRVVVTGMGIWSCIGKNKEEVKDSLYNGKSGIGVEQARLDYGYQSALTGIVERPKLKGVLDRRQRVGMSEEAEYAFMAAKEAFDEACVTEEYLKDNEVGIIFGNDSSAKAVIEAHEIMKEKKDSALVGSGSIFQSMNSTVNMNLSTIFHLKGINMTISAACASGSHSIGLGYMMIKQGLQDMVLVGGAQETNYYSMSSFDALGTFSTRMDEPTKASRPFDKDRDGFLIGEGGGMLVLESLEHAKARGAKILGEVVGYGMSSDAYHITLPASDGSGARRCMAAAVKDAGITPDKVGYINTHGTSTPAGDVLESMAIKDVFGEDAKTVKISSTKSMTGHLLGAAGAVEGIITMMAVNEGIVPPTINIDNQDEKCDLDYTPNKAVKCEMEYGLSNSFGFGGTNASLVFKKYVE